MQDMEFLKTLLFVLGLNTTLAATLAKFRKPRPQDAAAKLDATLHKLAKFREPRPQDHAKLDAILHKLAEKGVASLTEDEREHLRMVRDKLRRDEERRKRQF
jgi:hypothetical protein